MNRLVVLLALLIGMPEDGRGTGSAVDEVVIAELEVVFTAVVDGA